MYYFLFSVVCIWLSLLYLLHPHRVFLWLFVLVITAFSSLRFDAGFDYFNYIDIIEGYNDATLEPASKLAVELARVFNENQLFFFINSLVYVLSLAFGLHNFRALSLISLLLLSFGPLSLLTSFNLVRQYSAIALIFIAFSLFQNKKFLVSFLLMIMAVLFHKSAALVIPILLLSRFFRLRYSLLVYLSSMLVAIFFIPSFAYYLSEKIGLYQTYFNVYVSSSGHKIMLLLVFIFIVNHLFALVSGLTNRDFWLAHNLFFIGILIYFGLSGFGEHLARVSYYFIPFLYVACHNFYFSLDLSDRIAYLILLIFFCLVSFLGTLYFAAQNTDRDSLTNYQFYFLVE